jgi:hypothetical protein
MRHAPTLSSKAFCSVMKSTPETFAKVGEALYGPSWRVRLSDALKVAERTVRRWEHAESPIPEGIWIDLAGLCRKHSAELAKLADRIEAR